MAHDHLRFPPLTSLKTSNKRKKKKRKLNLILVSLSRVVDQPSFGLYYMKSKLPENKNTNSSYVPNFNKL